MMQISLLDPTFAPALLLAGVMGFAIQRGNTCTVAAMDQVVSERRWTRFRSIVEAALWVLGALLVARCLGLTPALPPGYATSTATVAGGALLGIGAFVNRACAFGAVARLGSGDTNYLATPVGFVLGCRIARALLGEWSVPAVPYVEPTATTLALLVTLLVAWMLWRVSAALTGGRNRAAPPLPARLRLALTLHVWQPGAATAVIGVAFVGMLLLVGAWAYTDGLVELSRGMPMSIAARTVLLLALFTGAVVGGYTAGRFDPTLPAPAGMLRCACGGALIGAGSYLVPGGNDGLILASMPLLWPYAWVAFASMALSIAVALTARRAFARD